MVTRIKRHPTGWEKIFISYLPYKGSISRIYKSSKKETVKKNPNNLINKWANELDRQFSEGTHITNKHMKKCSISLFIKEMQIKTTLRLYLILVRLVIIKKTNNKCWQGCKEKGTVLYCCWECKLVQSL
jgi:hypothetical protein